MTTSPEDIEKRVLLGIIETLMNFVQEIYRSEKTGEFMVMKDVRQASRETYKEIKRDLENLHTNIYGNDK